VSLFQQTGSNNGIQESDRQDPPIGNCGPVVPFLCGLFLFYGGTLLNYMNWGWQDDNCNRRWGWVGLVMNGAIMAIRLVLMFFVAPAYSHGA
jgi:hypothetical protein